MRNTSLSSKTLSKLQNDEPAIDLTDITVVLDFAESVRNLSTTRRQTIWTQNVDKLDIDNSVQAQTKLPQQMDDILLFLVIIYGKEKYPEEDLETELISKLKRFVISSAFTNIKNYLHSKYFPLLQDEFISNNNYFSSMIESYAIDELPILKRPQTLPTNTSMHSLSQSLPESSQSTCIEDYIYNKIQDKIIDLFNNKFKELEYKINNLSKEIYLIKYAMIEDAKQNNNENNVNTDDIMDEIKLIKRNLDKLMKVKKNKKNVSDLGKSGKPMQNKTKYKIKPKKHNTKSNGLRKWMKNECELPQYLDVFIENGIDNLDLIQHITITDLAILGINKLPDKIKIMQNIQKLKYEKQQLLS